MKEQVYTGSGMYTGEVNIKLVKGKKPYTIARNRNHATKEFLKYILKCMTVSVDYSERPIGIRLVSPNGDKSDPYPVIVPKEIGIKELESYIPDSSEKEAQAFMVLTCQVPFGSLSSTFLSSGIKSVELVSGKSKQHDEIIYATSSFSDIIDLSSINNTSLFIEWKLTVENKSAVK